MKQQKTQRKKLKEEMDLPQGVAASISGQFLVIKGPKGESKRELKQHNIKLEVHNGRLVFETKNTTKRDKKNMGTLRSHVKNMIKGSMEPHTYILKICAGHFPMMVSVADGKLQIKNFLGEKVPRMLKLKEGASVKVDGQTIHIESTSKETAGQVAADIEQLTRRPGFDTRVFQDGCYIIVKDGKELK